MGDSTYKKSLFADKNEVFQMDHSEGVKYK